MVATGNVTDQLAKGACQYDSTLGVIKLRTDTDARRSGTGSTLIFRCRHGVYRLRGTVLSCRWRIVAAGSWPAVIGARGRRRAEP